MSKGFLIRTLKDKKEFIYGKRDSRTVSRNTAVLQVCHQSHDEAKKVATPNVLLRFNGYPILLHCLCKMHQSVIDGIRRINVVEVEGGSKGAWCLKSRGKLGPILNLFQGLRLENVTIVSDVGSSYWDHDTLGDIEQLA